MNKKKEKYSNLIVSKSGETIETIVNLNILTNKSDKNLFITENRKSYLYEMAEKLKAELHTLQGEQKKFTSRIEYLAHPENLIKEIKSQFNYRTPDEKLILIVPDTTTTTEE